MMRIRDGGEGTPTMMFRRIAVAVLFLETSSCDSSTEDLEPFKETVAFPHGELWVEGKRIEGNSVEVVFDGNTFSVGGIVVYDNVRNPPTPTRKLTDYSLLKLWGENPFIKSRLAKGDSIADVRSEFFARIDSLQARGSRFLAFGELDSAIALLRSSELVDASSIQQTENRIQYRVFGDPYSRTLYPSMKSRFHGYAEAARRAPYSIMEALRHVLPRADLLVIGPGLQSYTGKPATEGRQQLEYVRQNGRTTDLAPGPFRHDSAILAKVIEANRAPAAQ
ncbi:MAG: hypothetical protein ACE5G2_10285 [Candidatus Krumholzibacteriia bacterium]